MDKKNEKEDLKNPLLCDDDSYTFVPIEVIQAFDIILNKMIETKQEFVKAKGENRNFEG